jgi:hypothetical protein
LFKRLMQWKQSFPDIRCHDAECRCWREATGEDGLSHLRED